MTTATVPEATRSPSAEATGWTLGVTIDLTDALPFDLPTLGHFGGIGRFKEGSLTEVDPDYIRPYSFTPHTVRIQITDGRITDQAAYTDEGLIWHTRTDGCQKRRDVYRDGVHRVHWPDWLTTLVDRELFFYEPRCRACGSELLSWQWSPVNSSGVVDGRLRASEVQSLFHLGCGECSSTVIVLDSDAVARVLDLLATRRARPVV